MKKIIVIVLVLGLFIGCRGVILNPEYSQLLDKTAAISEESASRAVKGELTEQEKTDILVRQARAWKLFVNGRDGVE